MTRNRVLGIIVVLIGVALIVFGIYSNNKDKGTETGPILSVASYNQTQDADATTVNAKANDVIVYTVSASNPTEDVISGFMIEVSIAGITNAATLIDASGGNYNSASNSLVWTPLDIGANSSIQKSFSVRVKDPIPSNEAERNLRLTYGNEVVVNISNVVATNNRPGNVGNKGESYNAPKAGIPGWLSFYLACFITFGILLFRIARRMGKPTN